jgi:hypothetical protein
MARDYTRAWKHLLCKAKRETEMTRESSKERTGWRDAKLSERHREYGFDLPCADIDFIFLEYDAMLPVAVMEYKRFTGRDAFTITAADIAMSRLRDNNGDPLRYFRVIYWDDPFAFKVTRLRDLSNGNKGNSIRDNDWIDMTELKYVEFLYWLRERTMPPGKASLLAAEMPPSKAV